MDNITVTKPFFPPLSEFYPYLEKIWQNKWLTNNGPFHQELESKLASYLGVNYVSLFTNGTIALITAFQALNLQGEVITTPYSFVATTHSLIWNNLKPVFVDIDKETFNINPELIEKKITKNTCAILPVHVYGNPCDNEKLGRIARKHNLKLIYDAAHAFGVTKNGESILNWGDLSILSFHATKVFNTMEGGAIISPTLELKKRIDLLKNFGFQDENTVLESGINGKMNEVQSAFGILQLGYVEQSIQKRKAIADKYHELLKNTKGITVLNFPKIVKANYSYYPILIKKEDFGTSRDEIYDVLKKNNILSRKYFYPLISNFPMYRNIESSAMKNLPVSNLVADSVLCLPIYPELSLLQVEEIVAIILRMGQ